MMVQQLAKNKATQAEPIDAPMPGLNTVSSSANSKSEVESTKVKDALPEFDSPQAFVNFMRPLAEQAASELGVKPQVLIAQAALETGWGQKIIKQADGSSSHNLFGIKADQRWPGKEISVNTLEHRHGLVHREQASFRSYESFKQSFDDYVDFVKQGPRYQQALNHDGDARHYIQSLQKAGYATDPMYAEKVIDIMDRNFG
jgi:flagellar protein FlgJ